MAILLFLSPHHHPPLNPPQNPNPNPDNSKPNPQRTACLNSAITKRQLIFKTTTLSAISLATKSPFAQSLAESSPPSKSVLSGIANTNSWFQYYGDGFAVRVPPQFEDIMEPEVYASLIGTCF